MVLRGQRGILHCVDGWKKAVTSFQNQGQSGPVTSSCPPEGFSKNVSNFPAGICAHSMAGALVKWAVTLENKVRWLSAQEIQVMKLESDCEEKYVCCPHLYESVLLAPFYDPSVAIWNRYKHYCLWMYCPTYFLSTILRNQTLFWYWLWSGCCQHTITCIYIV